MEKGVVKRSLRSSNPFKTGRDSALETSRTLLSAAWMRGSMICGGTAQRSTHRWTAAAGTESVLVQRPLIHINQHSAHERSPNARRDHATIIERCTFASLLIVHTGISPVHFKSSVFAGFSAACRGAAPLKCFCDARIATIRDEDVSRQLF
jgi:hypothetical protein